MVIDTWGTSTGGGIKVLLHDPLQIDPSEIHKMLHPNAVTMVRMNGKRK